MSTPTSVRPTAPRPPLRERLRREVYLLELRQWLDEYPARERRALVAQLRGELDAAAADTSMSEAVTSLGRPRALAREYMALLPGDRPRWSRGLVWLAGWLLVSLCTLAVFASALLQAAAGAGPDGAGARLLWAEMTAVHTPDKTSLAWTAGVPWGLLVGLAIFLVAARAWRVVPALRPAPGTDG